MRKEHELSSTMESPPSPTHAAAVLHAPPTAAYAGQFIGCLEGAAPTAKSSKTRLPTPSGLVVRVAFPNRPCYDHYGREVRFRVGYKVVETSNALAGHERNRLPDVPDSST